MAGNIFRGACNDIVKISNHWSTTGTLKVSLVAPSVAIDRDDLWLSDFLADPNTLIGAEQSLPGTKSVVWGDHSNKPGGSAGFNALEFLWTGQVTFTGVAASTQIAGVVGYVGSTASPSTARLWFLDINPLTAGGGDIRWGTTGTNVAFRLYPRQTGVDSPVVLRGFIEEVEDTAEQWGNDAVNTGYALVRNTGIQDPNENWVTVQDVLDAGVTFITGAAPGAAGNPVKTGVTARFDSGWEGYGVNDVWSFAYNATGDIIWDEAAITDGQVITAVLTYAYTGAFSAATAKAYFWDGLNAGVTIGAGQDVIYGNLASTIKLALAIQT